MIDEASKQWLREIVADNLRSNNAEFERQVRDGEQDDGPYMQIAFAVFGGIDENYFRIPHPEVIGDE